MIIFISLLYCSIPLYSNNVKYQHPPNGSLTPYSEALAALASGFSIISKDDYNNMTKQFYIYDALYAFCKSDNKVNLRFTYLLKEENIYTNILKKA
jgi:hypothetical protein